MYTVLRARKPKTLFFFRKEMHNTFNFLMMALFFLDSCFLIGSITESIRKAFNGATSLHIYLFPSLIYPGLSFAMTASIFMTVALAVERFFAVKYPIQYRLAVTDYLE